jgi:F-type H+-transporting ATPase subunit g
MAAAMTNLLNKIPGLVNRHVTPTLKTSWKYAKVELRPPTPGEVAEAVPLAANSLKNLASMNFLELPVKKAFQNALVVTEVTLWFFIGEVIGRKSLAGYKV